ncbi:lytic transglycosylase domain-containing protein [Rhodopseudomonas palustris]|uniref:transglycosylase SLT domain-containing protein n=1 Tax=Rhodopseudomonas palustris TaxID=1076 RepID=UPI00115E8118|nr:transglycosylase SLT domain-containing protein [Rhodopseudomonas palustris]QDL98045.1 lytic transglycosylase domain-containing protein [Rhodopseudomonas palustris]
MAAEVSNPAVMIVDPARTKVAGAIKQAAGQTGTSFQYLLATAKMESDFNPSAQATTSSAQGLFQFIEQTWLGTVKEAGAQFGYGQYADAITRSASGSYSVSDPSARTAIMNLRNDPVVSSAMAGVLTQSNSFKLTGEIGRRPSDAELYMAHFMGVAGAAKLINTASDTPNVAGAALFPSAAAANQSIFYDRSGNARSVSEVYSNLASRYEAAASSPATQSAIASVAGLPVTLASAAPPPAPVDNAAYLASFPDVRNVAPAQAGDAARTATAQRGSEPMFRSLFLGGDRAEPVSPAVQSLWSSPSPTTLPSQAAMPSQPAMPELSRTPEVRPPSPLDLFSDRSGAFAS